MSSSSSSSSGTTVGGSSSGSDDSGGRFSDDLEKLILRAGEKLDRSAAGLAATAEGEGAVAPREGEGVEEDPKLSARAMKFRAMISKLRPQKKAVVVKVCTSPSHCRCSSIPRASAT